MERLTVDALCGALRPEARKIFCTHPPGHEGDHHHEYTGTSWPRTPGEPG
ncbi:hypothetical protein ACWF94_12190 [Streptomyces sp. NPDC055078]